MIVRLILFSIKIFFIYIFCFKGCKTGMYYLRTKAAAQAIQFTVDKKKLQQSSTNKGSEQPSTKQEENEASMICSLKNKDDCIMCGS